MMKSLLYKEFAESRKWLMVCLAIIIAAVIFSLTSVGALFSDYMFLAVGLAMLFRNIGEDEKSGWEKYSRALPKTAIQRVGARYIFCIVVMAALTIACFLPMIVNCLRMKASVDDFGEYLLTTVRNTIPILVFRFSLILVSFTLVFPMSYIFKGQIRAVAFAIPIAPILFISSIVSSQISLNNEGFGTYNFADSISKPKFTVMILASALLLYAASYFISVIIETRSGRKKLKAVIAAAAVLTAVAVAFSGVTVCALNKDGAFEKDDLFGSEYEEKRQELDEEWERKNQAARKATYEYMEALSGETLVDKKIDDIRARLGEIGFGGCLVGNDELYSADKPLSVAVVTSDLSATPEYPESLFVATQVQATVIRTLDAEEKYAEIEASFIDGMPEADAVAVMKSYDLCPSYIGEYLDNGKPYRNYRFDIVLEDSFGNSVADMTLSIDIIDGVIHDARAYYYER